MLRRAILVVSCAALALAASAQERLHQPLRFGLRAGPVQWGPLGAALAAKPADPANPVTVTLDLPASWAAAPDWAALESAVAAASASRARLAVATELPGDPEAPDTLAYLVALSERVGRRADSLGLSLRGEVISETLKQDPDRLALTLKRLSSALRGAGTATVYFGEVDPAVLPLLEPLYARDLRAYVEGYRAGAAAGGAIDFEVHDFLQKFHPGAPLWVHLPPVKTALGAQVACLVALSRGADFADVEGADPAAVWEGLVHLRAALSRDTGVGFATEASGIWEKGKYRGDVGVLNFLDAETFVQGMLLVANSAGSPKGTLEITLPTEDLTAPRAMALPAGAMTPADASVDKKKHETTLRVPWEGTPVLVLFERLKTGTVGQESVAVSGVYRIPVEMILARHQAVQEAQDTLLGNYRGQARVDYHFKLPGSNGSLDVTFLNDFFFERGAGARWVQNQLLVNGVAWKGKTIPELPIIEPEKVNVLPLALTLGRDYEYKYLRDESVEGRMCYLVEFIPLPAAQGSLYEGRVWIDRETFTRVKMTVRQTKLAPPQVSNEETDFFTAVEGEGGRKFHLLTRMVGQQIFSFAGRNVVAEREVRFSDLRLNAADFRETLARAEAGDRPMLEETPKGPRYMEKNPDGTRSVQMNPKTSRLLAVGGVYYDESLDYPLPLAGVNYLNYDWKKTGTQVNLFAAGVVNSLTVSKVDLLPKADGRVDAVVFLVPFEDKYFEGGVEDPGQRLKILREFVSLGLGWRVTEFSKLSLGFDAKLLRFSDTSKTDPAFVLPKTHGDLALTLGYDYSRRGWSGAVNYEAHRRTAWEPWGTPGSPSDVSKEKAYALWDASFTKTFYLPKFQKISAAVSWLDGKDLDRFSRYEFTYMGKKSLSGFSGSGVRFDRGATTRLLYEFNVGDVIRFGMNVDYAKVKPLRDADGWQSHTGVGLSGSVAGPWKTLWALDVGYALQSDIPAARHNYTVGLVVLKLW